ncbi:MAG: serine/threonine-protein phosphatase [Lachnospira sp.]|nr:serine/threonine-protein phosphatase [Lachnospira sp.]
MEFLVTAHSDIGIKKKTNQDSVLLQVAKTDIGNVAFGVVCDGMGGLAKGELASATLIKAFANWFQGGLKELLESGFQENKLYDAWRNIITTQNQTITNYGNENRINLGTTVAGILLYNNRYYVMNVGDSRVYLIRESLQQITKDQSYIQREMDAGRMTLEQAKVDPQRNVLLQCVGASTVVIPDFFSGEVHAQDVFMLCSDGFRHVISGDEIYQYMNPDVLVNEDAMKANAVYLTDLDKYRQEKDNISVALIKVY